MEELSNLEKLMVEEGLTPAGPEGIVIEGQGDNNDIRLIDQDTGGVVATEEEPFNSIRFSGLNAPETQHLMANFQYKRGEVGGDNATLLGEKAIAENNFTIPKLTGNKGFFGRDLGDVVNPDGAAYSKFLLKSGAGYLGKYANNDDEMTSAFGALDRRNREIAGESTEWDKLVDNHNQIVKNGSLSIKPLAVNEAMYASAPDLYAGVSFRSDDRTLMNETKSWQLKEALSAGVNNGFMGGSTAIGMIEESFGVDSSENWGYAHAEAIKQEMSEAPYMRDMVAFDEFGEFTLDGISELTNYTFSNLLTSLPVMSVGIAAVVAMPATMGASLLAPASIYTGMNYDAQEDKDKGRALFYAIGQTALDIVGVKLGGAFNSKALASGLTKPQGRIEAVKTIAKATGQNPKLVSKLLTEAMKDTSSNVAKEIKAILDNTSSWLVKSGRVSVAGLKGMTSEGMTEAMQEYLAIQAENNKITPEEMLNRLLNAGFAGGMLGKTMSVTGATIGEMSNSQIQAGYEQARNKETNSVKTREMDAKNFPGVPVSVDTIINHTENLTAAERANFNTSNATMPEDATRGQGLGPQSEVELEGEVVKGKIDRVLGSVPGLIRGQLMDVLSPFQNSEYMSMLGSILGINTARGGLGFEDRRRQDAADLSGKKAFDTLYTTSRAGFRSSEAFSQKIYGNRTRIESIFKKVRMKEDINGDNTLNVTEELINSDLDLNNAELEFLTEVYKTNRENNDSPENTDTVLTKTVSRYRVDKDQAKMKAILMRSLGISRAEAERAITLFLQNEQYATPLDLIDIDSRNLQSSLDNYLNPDFVNTIENTFAQMEGASEFLDTNVFNNVVNNSARSSNIRNREKYLGKDGDKLANLLDLAFLNNEITASEKKHIASKLKDYYAQINGDYHRIDSKFYRSLMNNISFLTAMTALPLAAISSLVEIGFVIFQNNPAPLKTAYILAKSVVPEITATMNEGVTVLSRGRIPMREYTHREVLRKGGYLLDSQAPAARQGADVSPRQAAGLGVFFKASGLTGLTNIQRYARLAMAEDTVLHWMNQAMTHDPSILLEGPIDPKDTRYNAGNRYYAEAIEQLGNLGIQPEVLINAHKQYALNARKVSTKEMTMEEALKPLKNEVYLANLENAKIKFVDMAIAMPAVGNRPAFYNDPRWKLFTQFQGYISTATANLLPIMYNNLGGKEKMPLARVNAVATLASLLAISMFAQAMKDSVKMAFADDEAKERKEAYLNDWQKFIRGLYGSGAIGVLERPIDFFVPLYGDRPTATGRALGKTGIPFVQDIADTIISEAPGLSYADNALQAVYDVATQDKNALRNVMKVTPMMGPFPDWVTTYKGDN